MKEIEIKKLMLDHQKAQPDFTIDCYVIGSQGDDWMQYKQCLTEIDGKVGSIEAAQAELRLLKIDRNRWRLYWPSKYNIEKRRIEKERKERRIKSICEMILEYERELSRYLMHASELKKQFRNITKEKRIELDSESFKDRGLKLAAIDIISTGRVSSKTHEFIFSLPKDSKIGIFKTLANHHPMEVLGFSREEINLIAPPRNEKLK